MKLKQVRDQAKQYLKQYETQTPASYAAAQQAIGGLLMLDGFIGIDNPASQKRRVGIFGSLAGIAVGILFIFIPTVFNGVSGLNKLTSQTTATVVSIQQNQSTGTSTDGSSDSSSSCSAVVKYDVNGKQYQQPSSFSSSSLCGLAPGSSVTINYDPNNPSSWGYDVKTVGLMVGIFPIIGIIAIITGLFTFAIRLASIIFGWKILQSGRRLAATLPQGTDLNTIIDEIKSDFSRNLFGFGSAPAVTQPRPTSAVAPVAPPIPASPPLPTTPTDNTPAEQPTNTPPPADPSR